MLIRLKKTKDGVVLTCVRESGPVAVQRTGYGGFFAWHDLMHYAVETTLGFREAFFGLMAAGWSFETFADKSDPRYHALPTEAGWAEHIVAAVSRHLRDAVPEGDELLPLWAEAVNAELASACAAGGLPAFRIGPAQLVEIARVYRELSERWAAVPPGEHLELPFLG